MRPRAAVRLLDKARATYGLGAKKSAIALRVSAIHDQRQVVIKSLESNYAAIPGISAATILGDGKIALILDPEEVIKLAHSSPIDMFA